MTIICHSLFYNKRAKKNAERLAMFSLLPPTIKKTVPKSGNEAKNSTGYQVSINGKVVEAAPGENILSAALRGGLDFPHSCRVGGCATCKCKLVDGQVKELTETSYLLSESEIHEGTILACQSIPKSNVQIQVNNLQTITGKVVKQKIWNEDIAELTVSLDEALSYRAGQYGLLSIEGLDVERNYSFACAPDTINKSTKQNEVNFLIKKVPGGKFSNYIHHNHLIGKQTKIKGPIGDFYLRPGNSPILLVAGGSGLAPILSILEKALEDGVKRPVTVLFGARREKDLYKIKEIEKIQKAWKGNFKFIPILSDEPQKSSWKGARGLVTEKVKEHLTKSTEAYLCGPPPMVDSATKVMIENGISKDKIYADRFTLIDHSLSLKDEYHAEKPKASLFDYLKFSLFHLVGLCAGASLLLGGGWMTVGLISLLLFYTIGDAISGDDTKTPDYKNTKFLTFQLWMALPLLSFIVFSAVWAVSPGDAFGFGSWLSATLGYDFLAAKSATNAFHVFCGFVMTGLMIGLIGTITAHELTHRTWDPISMFFGRVLLAFSFDTIFSIEHVYGHHRYVSTEEDPATAPRGRNVYFHVIASTIKGNISAWKIEAARLKKKNKPVLSVQNAFIRGHLLSLLLVAFSYGIGGITGMIFFVCSAVWGKALLEIVNYMEHYGMVRLPSEPVQPRHSWNTNKRLSSWTMFNLTRHSHHHAQGEVAYQNLRPYPNAPMMISGYLTTIVIALLPPLWHKLMTPKVLDWDKNFATPEELELAERANAKSGIPELMQTKYLSL